MCHHYSGRGSYAVTEVYRGKKADVARRAKMKKAAELRRKNERKRLLKILLFCIVAVFFATRIMIAAAGYASVRTQAAEEQAMTIALNNRIGAVEFEIARETRLDNLSYKAAFTLGMIDPDNPSSLTARAN